LPVMSGTELLAALRQLTPSVPVLLVTASPAGVLAAAPGPPGPAGQAAWPVAPAAGRPDGLLVKPFRAEQLLSAVIRLAGGPAGS